MKFNKMPSANDRRFWTAFMVFENETEATQLIWTGDFDIKEDTDSQFIGVKKQINKYLSEFLTGLKIDEMSHCQIYYFDSKEEWLEDLKLVSEYVKENKINIKIHAQ